ncbi:MAG: DAK2 domain-containing protein [Evtepia sp.]
MSIELHIVVDAGVNIDRGLPIAIMGEVATHVGQPQHRRHRQSGECLRGFRAPCDAPGRRTEHGTDKISGGAFKQMVAFGAACITAEKQAINDLNVLPVPDGDTGTNMSLTIQTAVNELRKAEPATVDEAAKLTASGLLRGARGNSGVILSLLFRGMSKVLKGHDTADGALLAEAMQEGVSTAYGAVMKPAEGTVLTVSRLAAQRALEAAGEKNDAEFVLDEAIKTGYTTLAETIEMNPVLKKAGVVDAGGKGYLIILEGMLRALRGEPVPEVADTAEEKADFAAIGDEDITFAFDTVFIVRKTSDKPLDGLRAYLEQHRRQPGHRRG